MTWTMTDGDIGRLRGLPYMTSEFLGDFLTPSTLFVRKFAASLVPPLRTSYMEAPLIHDEVHSGFAQLIHFRSTHETIQTRKGVIFV